MSLGAITGPALSLIPQAIMIVARENPKLRVELHVESSNVLIESLSQGKIDIMIGRLFERQDKTGLRYERLAEEPVAAVVRPGHPLLNVAGLNLAAVEKKPWIVPPAGSVLRHRFDLMFREAGLQPPTQLIETASLLFVTKMLQQTDFIAVVPTRSGPLLRDLWNGGPCCPCNCPARWTRSASSRAPTGCCRRLPLFCCAR